MNEVFLMCNGNVLNQVRIYNSSSLGLLGLGAGAIRSLLYHDCLYNHGIMNYFLIFIVHFLRRFEYLYITCFSVKFYIGVEIYCILLRSPSPYAFELFNLDHIELSKPQSNVYANMDLIIITIFCIHLLY